MMNAPEVLEQLSMRLEELERRVTQLEQCGNVAPLAVEQSHGSAEPLMPAKRSAAPEPANGFPAMAPVVTVAGIALLGIAGAYVLRALAGASAVARPLLGFVGAAYAAAWAVASVRTSWRLAQAIYAAASVAILVPLLWEMCLRFRAMSPLAAAVVLCTYVIAICASARTAFAEPAFSILYAGSALGALVPCIGTRSMMPFIAILLAMVAVGEFRRMRGEALPAAVFVWLAADAAILAILAVYRAAAAERPEYPPLSSGMVLAGPILLFVIHTAAIAHQCCIRRSSTAVLDAMQWLTAFALLVLAIQWMAPSSSAMVVGALCLVLCAGCYWAALSRTADATPRGNFRVFAISAFLLLSAALWLLLPPGIAAVALGSAAILAMVAAQSTQLMTLRVHALGFILVGAFACGLPAYFWRAMVTDGAAHPGWSIVAMTTTMVLAYAACGERKIEADGAQVLHFALALAASCAVCAIVAHVLLMAAGAVLRPEVFHVALVRTTALCLVILTIVVAGARLERAAMSRVAYVLLGFVAIKLVLEDLRHGHLGYLAASIGIVAGTLIAMPRIAGRIGAMRP